MQSCPNVESVQASNYLPQSISTVAISALVAALNCNSNIRHLDLHGCDWMTSSMVRAIVERPNSSIRQVLISL